MRSSVVSATARVMRTRALPRPLTVPANTIAPAFLWTGTLSPVRVDSFGPGLSLDDLTVHGEALAGSHPDGVADGEGIDRHTELLAVAHSCGLPGPELDQRFDRMGGAVQGVGFEGAAEREEEEQDRPLGPVAEVGRPQRGENHQQVHAELPLA